MNDIMFNLDRAIRHWRLRYGRHRVYSSSDLDELERHLRDHVASLMDSGLDAKEAFFIAADRLGDGRSAVDDYRRVHRDKARWTEHITREMNYRFEMLIRHIRGALRQVRRHRMHSFINLFGLAVGLAVALLVLLFVRHELSYDTHIPEAERIHRLTREMIRPDGSTRLHVGYVAAPFAPALEDLFPEVSSVTRFWDENSVLLTVGDQSLYEDRVYYAEEDFLDLFSIRFLQGSSESALRDPDTAVLTESTSRKLFGDASPLGKTV